MPPPAQERLGLPAARRIVVAAQGLAGARPRTRPTAAHLDRVVDRLGVIQIDSVNVLARSHRLVLFARLGAHDEALVDRALGHEPRRLTEYWAHEASLLAPSTRELLAFRMARTDDEAWRSIRRVRDEAPETVGLVSDQLTRHGPMTARQLEAHLAHDGPREGNGYAWNWSAVKRALEYLFWRGEITSAGRTAQFERRYAPTEAVLGPGAAGAREPRSPHSQPRSPHPAGPGDALTAGAPGSDDPAAAIRELVRIAARSQGLTTTAGLRDVFRLAPADADPAIAALAEAGELVAVEVSDGTRRGRLGAGTTRRAGGTGWWLHRDAARPRRTAARALLSPFDSLVWHRPRTAALFGFHYRLEIYTPAHRRVHGYYVLPFLLGDRLVARVDLKADRSAGALLVRAAHAEAAAPSDTPTELAAELALMADWLGLPAVRVVDLGDLATDLAAAVG